RRAGTDAVPRVAGEQGRDWPRRAGRPATRGTVVGQDSDPVWARPPDRIGILSHRPQRSTKRPPADSVLLLPLPGLNSPVGPPFSPSPPPPAKKNARLSFAPPASPELPR